MDDLERATRRVGTTLKGRWVLERLLGVGGMATVYVARHKIGRLDAIKILHPEIASAPQLVARFEQEAHAVNAFRHPAVVEIRDIDVTEDGEPFLVMELLEGESLSRRAKREPPLTLEEILSIADETLDALAAAHRHGIVHRDIKPDNLFLTEQASIKVLDFGIARVRSGRLKTKTGTTLGTVAYMPPEQARGLDIDARADLYAVGATMFRLLARRPIHDADTDVELLMKVLSEPAKPLASVAPWVPPNVAAIVDRALAFAREHRYDDAATMQADIRAARGLPPRASSASVPFPAPASAPGNAAPTPGNAAPAPGNAAPTPGNAAPAPAVAVSALAPGSARGSETPTSAGGAGARGSSMSAPTNAAAPAALQAGKPPSPFEQAPTVMAPAFDPTGAVTRAAPYPLGELTSAATVVAPGSDPGAATRVAPFPLDGITKAATRVVGEHGEGANAVGDTPGGPTAAVSARRPSRRRAALIATAVCGLLGGVGIAAAALSSSSTKAAKAAEATEAVSAASSETAAPGEPRTGATDTRTTEPRTDPRPAARPGDEKPAPRRDPTPSGATAAAAPAPTTTTPSSTTTSEKGRKGKGRGKK